MARSSSVGALNEVIRTPCGSTSPTVCLSTPPLPEVSMPCSTSSTDRASGLQVRSANSRSCSSASSSPEAGQRARPSLLAAVEARRAVRRDRARGRPAPAAGAGAGGSSDHHGAAPVPPAASALTSRPRRRGRRGQGRRPAPRAPPRTPRPSRDPCAPASPPAAGSPWRGRAAAPSAACLPHQPAGGLPLVLGVQLVEHPPGHLVVDPLAAQLEGQRPAGQALALGRCATHVRANASSSTRPTSSKRSSRGPATSSGTWRWASLSASSRRLRARPVSWSSRIVRAT